MLPNFKPEIIDPHLHTLNPKPLSPRKVRVEAPRLKPLFVDNIVRPQYLKTEILDANLHFLNPKPLSPPTSPLRG